jgi:hypothetical protein
MHELLYIASTGQWLLKIMDDFISIFVGVNPYDPIFNYFHYPINLEASREVRGRRGCPLQN